MHNAEATHTKRKTQAESTVGTLQTEPSVSMKHASQEVNDRMAAGNQKGELWAIHHLQQLQRERENPSSHGIPFSFPPPEAWYRSAKSWDVTRQCVHPKLPK